MLFVSAATKASCTTNKISLNEKAIVNLNGMITNPLKGHTRAFEVHPQHVKPQARSQGSLLPVPKERKREPGNEVCKTLALQLVLWSAVGKIGVLMWVFGCWGEMWDMQEEGKEREKGWNSYYFLSPPLACLALCTHSLKSHLSALNNACFAGNLWSAETKVAVNTLIFLFCGPFIYCRPLPYIALWPRSNVELFMRRAKLSELSSRKVQRLANFSSSEWVWIVQHVLSICFSRIERLKLYVLFCQERSQGNLTLCLLINYA